MESLTGTRGPVVVGVDGSASSQGALRWAVEQAAERGAPLRVVHAVDAVENYAAGRAVAERATAAARGLDAAVPVRCATPMNSARTALLAEARHAALLVVGRSGRSRTALYLAAHAHCPVVLVPEPGTGSR